MIRHIVRCLIPRKLRSLMRICIDSKIRRFKSPRMIWGYMDASGEWREKTRISDTVFFNHPERVFIEDNAYIGHFSILDGTGNLNIEEGVQLAGWNGIYTHSSHIAIRLYGKHYQEVPEDEKKGYIINSVNIAKYAFIAAGAIILPGVSIGQGTLVAAGSVVKNDVDDYQIVSGNPARVVGDTITLDKRYLKDPQLLEWYNEWQKK